MDSSMIKISIKFRWVYMQREKKRDSFLKNEIDFRRLSNINKITAKDKVYK